jgi:hypothetical protein
VTAAIGIAIRGRELSRGSLSRARHFFAHASPFRSRADYNMVRRRERHDGPADRGAPDDFLIGHFFLLAD